MKSYVRYRVKPIYGFKSKAFVIYVAKRNKIYHLLLHTGYYAPCFCAPCFWRLFSMSQCISCGSFDVGRIHRNLLERFLIKKIYICHECDHKWKIWK